MTNLIYTRWDKTKFLFEAMMDDKSSFFILPKELILFICSLLPYNCITTTLPESTSKTGHFDPYGICFDPSGNMYVSSIDNNAIYRKAHNESSFNIFSGPRFKCPLGICSDSEGNIYVCDQFNHSIKMISPINNKVIKITGGNGFLDGSIDTAKFSFPSFICISPKDPNIIYVADSGNQRIRQIDLKEKTVSTFAGTTKGFVDGDKNEAKFSYPSGICVDKEGSVIVVDRGNNCVRKINTEGQVSTVVKGLSVPRDICVDTFGDIFVSDCCNNRIVRISNGHLYKFSGGKQGWRDGPSNKTRFFFPVGLCISPITREIFVVDKGNKRIRIISYI